MLKIVHIPLDERPCNYDFPKNIFSKVYAVCVFSAKHLDVSGNNHTFAKMKNCVYCIMEVVWR